MGKRRKRNTARDYWRVGSGPTCYLPVTTHASQKKNDEKVGEASRSFQMQPKGCSPVMGTGDLVPALMIDVTQASSVTFDDPARDQFRPNYELGFSP